MPLREELERSGNWLFRWRSYIPIVLFVPMALAMRQFDYPQHEHALQECWAFICLGISLAGLGIRALTIGYTPKGTSGRNTHQGQIAEVLNTTGIYSVVRNPLYLGNYVIWLGISLFALTWWLTVIFTLCFWIYYERIIFAEEEYLRRKFGDDYVRWAEQTPVFFPRWTQWRRSALSFSWRTVLRREYSGLFAIVSCFFLLEVSEHLAVEHRLEFEPHWIAIFLSACALYVVLRTLNRHTQLLHVNGR